MCVMVVAIEVAAVLLLAVAMALSLAHALEFPGKLRLSKDNYVAMQPIYYPGFTIGGIAEPLAILAIFILLIITPFGTPAFWLTLVALLGVVGSHLAYWLLTHPVNNFWLRGEALGGAGGRFFGADPLGSQQRHAASQEGREPDWTALRDRWEYSHLVRAVLAGIGFLALTTAVAL
jgi:hypothetical protein